MSKTSPRFVIVPHRPRRGFHLVGVGVLWLLSLLGIAALASHYAVPHMAETARQLADAKQQVGELGRTLEGERQRATVLERSDQVSRDALAQLQQTLSERDEEIAALRADVAFYERLVGGSAQRQGLTVHAVSMRPGDGGEVGFRITLTQNLKKSGKTRGNLSFSIEGVQSGKLTTLQWGDLRQQPDAKPQEFEFRYFQQVEGSVMLPAGFTPQRVRVVADRDGSAVERTVAWEDTQKSEGA